MSTTKFTATSDQLEIVIAALKLVATVRSTAGGLASRASIEDFAKLAARCDEYSGQRQQAAKTRLVAVNRIILD